MAWPGGEMGDEVTPVQNDRDAGYLEADYLHGLLRERRQYGSVVRPLLRVASEP